MKKIFFILAMLVTCLALFSPEKAYGGVSFGVFYSSLDQYGEWITISGDVYAWRPTQVSPDWKPYTYGRWVWTDCGWYWTSDEPWGWAVYHYGRWYFDDYYGWVWIPGYDWAPAWVEWRYGGESVGWAPLGPYAVFSASFGIFYRTSWVTPYHYWCFTDWRYLTSPSLHDYVYRHEANAQFIGRTRSGGSVQYDGSRIISRGPERQFVERRGNIRIERAAIVDATNRQPDHFIRSGDRSRLEVYRPNLDQGGTNDIGRPSRIREGERSVRLDMQNLDIRARQEDRRAGRGGVQTEQNRVRRDNGSDPTWGFGRVRVRPVNPGVWSGRGLNRVQPRVRETNPPASRREVPRQSPKVKSERQSSSRRSVAPPSPVARQPENSRDNGRRRF